MKKLLVRTALLSLCFASIAQAKQIAINEVVGEIIQNSNSRKAEEFSVKSSEGEASKAEKHWLPTLYIDGTTYQTNDPAKNFMGNLYQRSVRSSDFNSTSINANNSNNFSRSAVGVNLPLYQGGSGIASSDMAKNIATSQKYNLKQAEVDQYSYATAIYISLVSLSEQKKKLQKIANNIDEITRKYSLGNKNNPVGYSGALILEASQNKTKVFLNDNQEKTAALYQILKEIGFENYDKWNVVEAPLNQYLDRYLRFEKSDNASFKTSALKAKAAAAKNEEKISNAKNLPQISAYAENYQFHGSRATQSGYTAGLNLHWSFYDPSSFGNKEIAQDTSSAIRHQYLAQQQNERAEIEYLNSQIKSLEQAVKLTTKNDELMFKNVKISKELFRSGAITASALSDSIMKYLDNFVYLSNAELQLIELYSKKLTKQQVDISEIIYAK